MGHERHAASFCTMGTPGALLILATRIAATLAPALLLAPPLAASPSAVNHSAASPGDALAAPLVASPSAAPAAPLPASTLAGAPSSATTAPTTSAALTPSQLPPDSMVLRLIRERVESGRNPGIVVGLLDKDGTRVVAYGSSGVSGLSLNGRTIFEIGSVTKTFTTSLLADMVARGEVRLDEPVGELLPDSVRVPNYRGRQITLLDLATHTSGLPRIPTNLDPRDPEDPWADYTVSDLYQFLNSYELPRAPGTEVAYSNIGLGLLGYALALRGGKPYEELLRERILDPLGMGDTRITLSPAQERRLARAHDESGKAVAHWHIPTLPGAGALRSDVDDLFRYLAAHLGLRGGDLIPVLASTHQIYTRLNDTLAVALGWLVDQRDPARPFWYHNGETGGFHSFAAFQPAGRRAVIILSNGANSIDDIGLRILELGDSLAAPAPSTPPARSAPAARSPRSPPPARAPGPGMRAASRPGLRGRGRAGS